MGGVGVGREACVDVCALFFGEEGGRVGVVRDEPVCEYGDDDGEKAIDDEDPTPAVQAANAAHVSDPL